MKTNVKKLMTMAIAAAALAACSSNDVFDENFVENNQKASYAENFAKKYPNINMNQSWDYSHKQEAFSFGGIVAGTRADVNYNYVKGGLEEVDLSTVDWMKKNLVEGRNNRSLGSAFYMTVPGSEFSIMPIFQGEAGAVWDLHVVVNGVDIKIWSKSDDIQLTTEANPEWHSVVAEQAAEGGWEAQRNTLKATAVKAAPYTFKNLPVGADMYFYLDITKSGSNGYDYVDADGNYHEWKWYEMNNLGDHMTSVDQMMLAMQGFSKPSNVPEGYEYMLVGCEDANLADSDWDMNDVVFLVYGPKIPKPIEIKQGDPVLSKTIVRYMIEDLGATDDFDFNDIVVDVANVVEKTPVYTNGVLTSWDEGDKYQEATIRHLGGTLPFILTIGNTTLDERQGVLGADPDETFRVSGWDINRHNVSVRVKQNASSDVYNTVGFPKAGEAPMIIAVDPTQGWMSERVSVPESWFYVPDAE